VVVITQDGKYYRLRFQMKIMSESCLTIISKVRAKCSIYFCSKTYVCDYDLKYEISILVCYGICMKYRP
jgi:hypothetical protein